ncbi:MAG TPA: NAD-dependent epimerase/dehydratase family protein [Patescibacteria group bacterium]
MRILVTGGAGFIGTNFVYHMVSLGHDVTVLDKLTYAGGRDNLEPLGSKVKLVVGDICDSACVGTAVQGIDWVAHFAAESHNTRSEFDPDVFYRTNVEGTRVMLDESLRANVKRFLHISTDEVYGSIENGYFAEADKIKGDSQATSAYSKSKSLADDLALEYAAKGAPILVSRTTNNFGPWQFPEKALPRWITNLLMGKKIPLWGEGLQVRDWLYAPIHAEALNFVLEHGQLGEAYNIAANHDPEITNKQAALWLCEILHKDPEEMIEYIPDPRPNHDFRYALNTEKIASLGWKPSGKARSQFEETVEWYQSHEAWWRKRKEEAERIYQ